MRQNVRKVVQLRTLAAESLLDESTHFLFGLVVGQLDRQSVFQILQVVCATRVRTTTRLNGEKNAATKHTD